MNNTNNSNDGVQAGCDVDTDELYAKAAEVNRRIDEMRERLDESVFTGESENGFFKIALYGDGRPAAVEICLDLGDEQGKALFEAGLFEALEDAFRLRMEALDKGLQAIQDETGVGQDFKVPF